MSVLCWGVIFSMSAISWGVKFPMLLHLPRTLIFKGRSKGGLVVFPVIPAKAGIQYFNGFLDSRLRGSDDLIVFFSDPLVHR